MDIKPFSRARLVVFDVEGVLIPKNLFIYELSRGSGFLNLVRVLSIGFLYQIRILNLKSALRRIFRLMKGAREERLREIAESIPILPQTKESLKELKENGSKIAIISSGLPAIVVNYISNEIGADYAFGFEIGSSGGTLNGEIWGEVIEKDGKRKILSQILSAEKLTFADCVVVVDDRNNVPMFHQSMLKIGYNPDFTVRLKADNVITGNLGSILPVIMGRYPKPRFPSKNDLRREAIHLSAISIPILVMLLGQNWVVFLISVIVSLYIVSEIARMEGKNLPLFSKITNLAASQTELYEFAAAPIYFALGILLTLVLFPVPENSAAIAIFAVGDSSASLLGGLSTMRNPINKGKTLGGSVGGFVFAFLAGAIFITPWKALVGAMIAMTVEALPSPLNDNITIPISAALGMTLLQ